MPSPTSKDQLLAAIREERAAIDALIVELSDARLSEPGVGGSWSIKDVLAHITWWELRTLQKLNNEATPFQQPGEDQETAVNRVNNAVYLDHRDQPAAEIKVAYYASYQRLLEGLQGYAEAHLLANLEGIAEDTYLHYPEHVAAIREWLARG